MLKLTDPRLGRFNVVGNSFGSCVSNAAKEFSRAPEVPFPKMVPQPGMLPKQLKGTVSLKQLQSFTDTQGRREFNKQMDVVNSNFKFIDFALFPVSDLPQEKLAIHPESVKLERVFSIFNFPHEVECVLSEAMFSGSQIHFSSPKSATREKAHANLNVYFEEPSIQASPNSQTKELNFEVNGDSSPSLKAWVSSPWM